MQKEKKKINIHCPRCGRKFAFPQKEFTEGKSLCPSCRKATLVLDSAKNSRLKRKLKYTIKKYKIVPAALYILGSATASLVGHHVVEEYTKWKWNHSVSKRKFDQCLDAHNDPFAAEKHITGQGEVYGNEQMEKYFKYRRTKVIDEEIQRAKKYLQFILSQNYNNLTPNDVELFALRYQSVRRLFGINAEHAIKDFENKMNLRLDVIQLFHRALILRDSDAQYELGIRYYYGSYPVLQNRKEGLRLIKLAADQNHQKAKYFLDRLI